MKTRLYKTAKARIACQHFAAGEYVNLTYSHTDDKGRAWYDIDHCERGPLPSTVSYPAHHLEDFCL